MAWDDEPPKKEELNASWDAEPPKPEELEEKYSRAETMGPLGTLIDNVVPALEAVDSVTGAPTRSAVDAGLQGENPFTAFGQQFGEDPSKAPTGEDIMQTMGVPESMSVEPQPGVGEAIGEENLPKINPRKILGVGADMALDPLNAIPGKFVSKVISKGASKVGHGLAKIGEGLTGIPSNDIKVFATRADEVEKLAKSNDKNIALAADSVREDLMQKIKESKTVENSIIDHVLNNSKKTVSIIDPMKALKEFKSKLNPKLYPAEIAEVEELEKTIRSVSKNGRMSVKEAFELNKWLQEKASSAYAQPGKIYGNLTTKTAEGAKAAAAKLRMNIRDAEKSITKSMATHSALHDIQDKMNANILAVGKPEAALLAAGSGSNQRGRQNLKVLSRITKSDMLTGPENLSAMRYFSDAPFLPVDTTGKSMGRMGISALAGMALGGTPGALIGTAASSPYTLKKAIQLGRGVGQMGNSIGKASPVLTNNMIRGAGRELSIQQDNSIEGYPETATLPVEQHQKSMIEQEINADASLNVIERARQLRLLRKYNRMVIPSQP